MVASSTSTLLEVINQTLLDIGERQVTAIVSPFAKKASQYVQEAVRDLQHLHTWEWLYDKILATTWVNQVATLSNIQRIEYVSWDSTGFGGAYQRLNYVDPEIFDATIVPDGFVSTSETSTRPIVWTMDSYNTARVNPYPTDSSGQARVVFYALRDMVPPTTTTGVFPVPEYIIPLVRKRAVYLMTVRHLEDAQSAQMIAQEFDQMLHQLRTRNAKTPIGGQMNMYKRNRRYTL